MKKISLIIAFIIIWSLEKYLVKIPTLGGQLGLYTPKMRLWLQRISLISAFILLWFFIDKLTTT